MFCWFGTHCLGVAEVWKHHRNNKMSGMISCPSILRYEKRPLVIQDTMESSTNGPFSTTMLNYQRVCPRNSRLSVWKAAKLCTCPLWNWWGFEFQPLLEKYLTIPYLGRLCFDRGMETLHWKNTMTEKPCVYINKINIRMSLSLSISILCVCIYIYVTTFLPC